LSFSISEIFQALGHFFNRFSRLIALRVVELLEIDESRDVILLGKALDEFRLVLEHAPDQIIRLTDIQRAADAAAKDIDVIVLRIQLPPLGYWIARSSRAMTVEVVAAAYVN
jgi:hypothetical protein